MEEGIVPFDLSPATPLFPDYSPLQKNRPEVSSLPLGDENEAQFKKITYLDGTSVYRLHVPCEDMNHCHTCECSAEHYIAISPEQAEKMRELL